MIKLRIGSAQTELNIRDEETKSFTSPTGEQSGIIMQLEKKNVELL